MRALLVENGRDRSMLAAARALAAAGWTVDVTSWGETLAGLSRSVARWHRSDHTDEGDEAFVGSVARIARQRDADVVVVSWEAGLRALSARREELGRARVLAGDEAAVQAVLDKAALSEAAARAGLDVPPTVAADEEAFATWGHGPLVVKPALQWPVRLETQTFPGPTEEARRYATSLEQAGVQPLLQPWLAGRLGAFCCSCRADGELVTVSQQIAEQQWPQPVGVTARGVTVPVEERLREGVSALVASIGWTGLLQVQYLVDGDRRWFLDANPRPYGSIALAIRAGADHVTSAARIVCDLPVTPFEAPSGVRFQWASRDLRASLRSEQRGRELLRFAAALGSAHSVWSGRDPMVTPRFALHQLRQRLGRH